MNNSCLTPEAPTDPDCTDFILSPDTSIWITINQIQIYISPIMDRHRDQTGVKIEVSPLTEPFDPFFTRSIYFPSPIDQKVR